MILGLEKHMTNLRIEIETRVGFLDPIEVYAFLQATIQRKSWTFSGAKRTGYGGDDKAREKEDTNIKPEEVNVQALPMREWGAYWILPYKNNSEVNSLISTPHLYQKIWTWPKLYNW